MKWYAWLIIAILVLIIFILLHKKGRHQRINIATAQSVYGGNPSLTLPAAGFVVLSPPLQNSDQSITAYYSVANPTAGNANTQIYYDQNKNIILDLSKF